MVGYSNANWAQNVENRKSAYGVCFFIDDFILAWVSKKQNSISFSIAKLKCVVVGSCCT